MRVRMGILAALMLGFSASAGEADEAFYQEGLAAAKAGDPKTAVVAFERCVKAAPERPECRWELGWAYWSLSDWERVVATWEALKTIDPAREKLDKYLGEAKDNLEGMRKMREVAKSAPATVRPPIPAGKKLRLRAVGDVMLGSDYPDTSLMPPDDGAAMLTSVKPLLVDADLTFANLEGPFCDGGATEKCAPGSTSCYAFRTPTRYGKYLTDAGIDLASTANNHAGDFGDECRRSTEKMLDQLGIVWSGAPGSIGTYTMPDGLKVGLVGFHTSPSVNNVNDTDAAIALVSLAAKTHDWVIVSFHGGAEGSKAMHVPNGQETFYGENRGDLRKFARAVIGAGADVVIGHGPHVPRGFEVVDGHLVAYSLGNFATYGRFNLSGHLATSLVLEVTLDEQGKLAGGKILPVVQKGKGVPEPDPANLSVDLIRMLSEEDFAATAPVIAQDGSFGPKK